MGLSLMASQIKKKLLITIFTFLFCCSLRAEEKSLLEWGMFIGHGGLADYPSSNEYRYRTLPFPYVNYHGEFFRSDNEHGTRLRFIKDVNFDFDLSFGGSFPTETDNNSARAGMPKLDWTLEVGPRFLYYFYRDANWGNVRLGLPLRKSYATNFQFTKEVGYLFSPTFQIDKYNFLSKNLDLFFILTFNYFDEGEADYFFEIDPNYATSERNAYNAKQGLLSYDFSLTIKYQAEQKLFLLGTQYSDFSQSANRDSFLHKTNSSLSYFIGFGWLLFESEEKVLN